MIQWKDSTSYSQSEKERTPRTWKAEIKGYEVIVTRIVHCPDSWFLRCRDFGIDSRELRSKDAVYAKHEAVLIFKMKLLEKIEKMQEALEVIDQYLKE